MKKVLLLTALAVLLAVPAMAAIKATRHNLGTTGDYTYTATGTTQICIFCHTPHNPTQKLPLWNRNNGSAALAMYTGSPSLNLNKGALSTDSISLFCLSCHDGVTSLNNIKNTAGEPAIGAAYVNRGTGSKTNIGGDASQLSNDHPVNFNYDNVQTADLYFKNRTDVTGLRFFKSAKAEGASANAVFVECATCHDPHGVAGVKKFLRKSNDSSSLCLSCHTK